MPKPSVITVVGFKIAHCRDRWWPVERTETLNDSRSTSPTVDEEGGAATAKYAPVNVHVPINAGSMH